MPRGTGLTQLLLKKRNALQSQIAHIDAVLGIVKGHKRMGPKPGFKRHKKAEPAVAKSRQPNKGRTPLGVKARPKEMSAAAAGA